MKDGGGCPPPSSLSVPTSHADRYGDWVTQRHIFVCTGLKKDLLFRLFQNLQQFMLHELRGALH